jgi:hypothetical protein
MGMQTVSKLELGIQQGTCDILAIRPNVQPAGDLYQTRRAQNVYSNGVWAVIVQISQAQESASHGNLGKRRWHTLYFVHCTVQSSFISVA